MSSDPALLESGGVPVRHTALSELAAKLVDDTLIPLHRQRVAEMGIDASGLSDYYGRLLHAGAIAAHPIGRIAEIAVGTLPALEGCHVLRAGLGELAFVLALMGVPTVACEANVLRFEALCAGYRALTAVAPNMGELLALNPEAMGDRPPGNRLLGVAYHLVGVALAEEDRVLDAISHYRALLIEPRTFLRLRPTPSDRAAALDLVRRRGFSLMREFPEAGVVFCARPA